MLAGDLHKLYAASFVIMFLISLIFLLVRDGAWDFGHALIGAFIGAAVISWLGSGERIYFKKPTR
jgi:hypothetical protein